MSGLSTDVKVLAEAIKNADINIVIDKWNELCVDYKYNEYIYENDVDILNDVLEAIVKTGRPMDYYRAIANGKDYSEGDKYFYFDDLEHIHTFSIVKEGKPFDFDEMAEWIIENDDYDFINEIGLEADEDENDE